MTIAPVSARRGSEPIAGAKVIISSELTKKSQQKVSFDRQREDFGSIFWQERRNIVFLQTNTTQRHGLQLIGCNEIANGRRKVGVI